MDITIKQPTAEQLAGIEAEAREVTRGRAIIDRLRAGRATLVEARDVEGGTVYIKRLSWPEITRVKLAIPRDKAGVLNLQNEDHLRAVTAAMIATAIVASVEDVTPVFSNVEAVELVDEPGALSYVAGLFNAVCEVNPDVLPNSPGGTLEHLSRSNVPQLREFFGRYPDQRRALFVAYRRDLLERSGLLEAYRTGQSWALDAVSESLEFYEQLFALPEYQPTPL